jgi:D-3-phosphoglycerate dehydrogenase
MSPRVLVTDYPGEDLAVERSVLEPVGVELAVAPGTDEGSLVDAVPGVDGILVCYAGVTERVLAAAGEGCRIVARYGIGYDNVDIEAARRSGVTVTNVPDYCLDEVADHTLALILAHLRGIAAADRDVRGGGWTFPRDRIRRLFGLRLSLLGLGGIGRRVATRARAFGFVVTAYDPFLTDWDLEEVARADSVTELVSNADILSLHVPLTSANRHIINADTIAAMRGRPLLVNTARGGLVDLDAATTALAEGCLSGLAIDVAEPEPLPPDHPLRAATAALVTPHMAFHSVEATEELRHRAASEVARSLSGLPPDRPVNLV